MGSKGLEDLAGEWAFSIAAAGYDTTNGPQFNSEAQAELDCLMKDEAFRTELTRQFTLLGMNELAETYVKNYLLFS